MLPPAVDHLDLYMDQVWSDDPRGVERLLEIFMLLLEKASGFPCDSSDYEHFPRVQMHATAGADLLSRTSGSSYLVLAGLTTRLIMVDRFSGPNPSAMAS